MKLYKNECYASDDGKEVATTRITEERIEYRDILGWDAGWPTLGHHHSSSRAQFEKLYPNWKTIS